jgi:hypothetical protein
MCRLSTLGMQPQWIINYSTDTRIDRPGLLRRTLNVGGGLSTRKYNRHLCTLVDQAKCEHYSSLRFFGDLRLTVLCPNPFPWQILPQSVITVCNHCAILLCLFDTHELCFRHVKRKASVHAHLMLSRMKKKRYVLIKKIAQQTDYSTFKH